MVATIGRAVPVRYRGLEQFPARAKSGGIDFCMAGSTPYALEFSNEADVICLLLGDIVSNTRFDDDREKQFIFHGETTAFHPGHGKVRVAARTVRHGFVAFSYSEGFQGTISDLTLAEWRRAGSANNIHVEAIRHLARYARDKIAANGALDPLEAQYLGGMVYIETLNGLRAGRPTGRLGLSDPGFRRIVDYIDAELGGDISCEALAKVADVPLRTVFAGIKARTGLSPYQFVIDRRIDRARAMLERSDLTIADVALACGFASQQHMTATLSRRLGVTPSRMRRN